MATNKDKAGTVRCVYVLPGDIHDRVVKYQRAMGLSSEVEAARRLLDKALKGQETHRDIAERFRAEILKPSTLRQAASVVLAGHPLVQSIEFDDRYVKFATTTMEVVTVRANGEWDVVTTGCPPAKEARHVA